MLPVNLSHVTICIGSCTHQLYKCMPHTCKSASQFRTHAHKLARWHHENLHKKSTDTFLDWTKDKVSQKLDFFSWVLHPNQGCPASSPLSSAADFSAAMAQMRRPKTALATTSAME